PFADTGDLGQVARNCGGDVHRDSLDRSEGSRRLASGSPEHWYCGHEAMPGREMWLTGALTETNGGHCRRVTCVVNEDTVSQGSGRVPASMRKAARLHAEPAQ